LIRELFSIIVCISCKKKETEFKKYYAQKKILAAYSPDTFKKTACSQIKMAIRRPIITLLGHVDHGKSSILDKIRGTAIVAKEAGGITQAIGCSLVSIKTIEKICGPLLTALKSKLTIPGLLFIDSPGHAAFTSLRKRGGSLADLAILVVDIHEGFKPQTIESLEILKAHKVPFIVAVNKIDLISGWNYDPKKLLLPNLNQLNSQTIGEFEKKMYELVAQFSERGLQAERFDRVQDYTKQIALVPISAKSGQGIPELLMVLTGLGQKYLEQQLTIEESGPCRGTILEVKEEKGLGITIDAIIYNGRLKVNEALIIGGIKQAFVVKVKALLEPEELAEMHDKKGKYKAVKEIVAATGVKISALGLEEAVAGMPIRGIPSQASSPESLELIKTEIQEEVGGIIVEDSGKLGLIIKADTVGGLEALRVLLQEKNIPVSSSSLGAITKKDLSRLESVADKDKFLGVLLAFNVTLPRELDDYIKSKGLKIIANQVIYKIIEDYEHYISSLKKNVEMQQLAKLVRPCKFFILKGYVFRQNNPAIVGVEIEIGTIRSGDPIMNLTGKSIGKVKSMKEGQDNLTVAVRGKQIAMAIDGATVGRQIKEGDVLLTDISETDFKALKELKKHLTGLEVKVLKEIAEIKRRNNPVWGVG